MHRSLGTLLLLATLAAPVGLSACGSDDSRTTGSTTGSTTDSKAPETAPAPTDDTTDWTQVAILSASNARGEVAPTATALPDDAAVAAFTGQFDDGLATEVAEAARGVAVPDGEALYGAVVALGCETPDGVSVTRDGDDVQVSARTTKPSTSVQCLVPVTSVALVLVEQSEQSEQSEQ